MRLTHEGETSGFVAAFAAAMLCAEGSTWSFAAAAPIKCSGRGHPAHLSTYDDNNTLNDYGDDSMAHEAAATVGCQWAGEVGTDWIVGKVRAKPDGPNGVDCNHPEKVPACAAEDRACCDGGFLTGNEPCDKELKLHGAPCDPDKKDPAKYVYENGRVNFNVCDAVITATEGEQATWCQLPCQAGNAVGRWKWHPKCVKWVEEQNSVRPPHGHHDACYATADPGTSKVFQAHCHGDAGGFGAGELVRGLSGNARECHVVVKGAVQGEGATATQILNAYTFVVVGCQNACNAGAQNHNDHEE